MIPMKSLFMLYFTFHKTQIDEKQKKKKNYKTIQYIILSYARILILHKYLVPWLCNIIIIVLYYSERTPAAVRMVGRGSAAVIGDFRRKGLSRGYAKLYRHSVRVKI